MPLFVLRWVTWDATGWDAAEEDGDTGEEGPIGRVGRAEDKPLIFGLGWHHDVAERELGHWYG